jgi:hypothetical protein
MGKIFHAAEDYLLLFVTAGEDKCHKQDDQKKRCQSFYHG